ncbi:MAG: heavy metal-associated domain-containing protein [Flavobacteriales bacterium]|nr:heavy metal-associated domain-containing protein [Flavobacteriales bacterium]
MNKLVKFSLLLSVVFTVISCSESTAQSKKVTQEVSSSGKMLMNIEGMTCAMGCARSIEVELKNIDGVRDALVDFSSATASVSFDSAVTSGASLVDFVNSYRNGAFKAALIPEKSCSTDCTKSCCANGKVCTAEQKAKCKASGAKCCSKDAPKSCAADCTKSCCDKKEAKRCEASCTKSCCAK